VFALAFALVFVSGRLQVPAPATGPGSAQPRWREMSGFEKLAFAHSAGSAATAFVSALCPCRTETKFMGASLGIAPSSGGAFTSAQHFGRACLRGFDGPSGVQAVGPQDVDGIDIRVAQQGLRCRRGACSAVGRGEAGRFARVPAVMPVAWVSWGLQNHRQRTAAAPQSNTGNTLSFSVPRAAS